MIIIYSSSSSSDSSFSSSISSTIVGPTSRLSSSISSSKVGNASSFSSSKSSATFGPSSSFYAPEASSWGSDVLVCYLDFDLISPYLHTKTVKTLTTHLLNLASAPLTIRIFSSSYASYLTISLSITYCSFDIAA